MIFWGWMLGIAITPLALADNLRTKVFVFDNLFNDGLNNAGVGTAHQARRIGA